jgi:hypothetical protein
MFISTSSAALFDPRFQLRVTIACLGASVALHALGLVTFQGLPSSAPSAGEHAFLTATLAPRSSASAPAEPVPAPPRRVERAKVHTDLARPFASGATSGA